MTRISTQAKVTKRIEKELSKGIEIKNSSERISDFFNAETKTGDIVAVCQYSSLTIGVLTNITPKAVEISCFRNIETQLKNLKHVNYIYYPSPQFLPYTAKYADAINNIQTHDSTKRLPSRKTLTIINLTKLTGCKYMPKIKQQDEIIEDRS